MGEKNKSKPIEELKYDEALIELQAILSSLQDETLSIDDLTTSIKRAAHYLD